MEKHKEVFFVIRLHSAQSAASLAVSIRKHPVSVVYLINLYLLTMSVIANSGSILTPSSIVTLWMVAMLSLQWREKDITSSLL